jgi:O-antigen/teichoic acid export membrane protein
MKWIDDLRQWSRQEFTRYSVTLLSTSTLAQIIGLVVYPLLTRMYTPEDFGVLNVLLSVAGLLAIVSTGRYEPALVLEKDDASAKSLLQLILLISLAVFAVGQLVFTLFAHPISAIFKSADGIECWLPILPLLVLMMGLWQALNHYCIRQKKFNVVGENNLVKSSLNAGLKLLFGYAGKLRSGLVLSTLISWFSALLLSLFRVRKYLKGLFNMDKNQMREMAVKYANFSKFELPQAVSNMLAGNLPLLMLPLCFGMDEVGLFSLALTIGFYPVGVFTGSMDQVLYKRMVEQRQQNEEVLPMIARFCRRTFLVLLPFFVLFFFIAEWFFSVVFGAQWTLAGTYFKIMLPWLFVVTMTASLTFIPKVYFKQKTAMLIEFAYIVLRIAALCVGMWQRDLTLAILYFSIVSAIMVSIQLIWYFSLLKKDKTCSI